MQTRPPDEILVCVRPEDSATRAVLATTTHARVHEVLVDRPGVIAARNAGLNASIGDVLAYLDDDAVPHADWLERLLQHYDTDPSIGAVGGRDRVHHGSELIVGRKAGVGTITRYGRWITQLHLGYGPPRDVHLLKGANMSYRRQWLPDLRWDTNLRGDGAEHHEDSALALAIKAAGFRVVYDPSILVDHYEADRGDSDPREQPQGRTIADWAHNQTYDSVRYLPPTRAAACVAYGLLIGTRPAPGLGMGVRRLLAREQPTAVVAAVRQALRGRVAGLRTGRRARRESTSFCRPTNRRRGTSKP